MVVYLIVWLINFLNYLFKDYWVIFVEKILKDVYMYVYMYV